MIRRREWLFVVGGGLLAACAGPTDEPASTGKVSKAGAQPSDPKAVSPRTARGGCTLNVSAEGQKIGRTYTRQTSSEATAERLRAALPPGPAALTARISADYAQDDVLVLRGWVLARTEARLLALGALEGGCVAV